MKIEKFPAICRFTFGKMSDYDKNYYERNKFTLRAYEKYPKIYENRISHKTYVIKENSLLVIVGKKLQRLYHPYDLYAAIPLEALLDNYTPIRAINRWTTAFRWMASVKDTELKPLFDEE